MVDKPTPSQLRALRNLAEGKAIDCHIRGRSAAGGFSGTLASLFRRGWIDRAGITAKGRAVLAAAERKAGAA